MLETNLDDLPAEVIGYCYDACWPRGRSDVFSTPHLHEERTGPACC